MKTHYWRKSQDGIMRIHIETIIPASYEELVSTISYMIWSGIEQKKINYKMVKSVFISSILMSGYGNLYCEESQHYLDEALKVAERIYGENKK